MPSFQFILDTQYTGGSTPNSVSRVEMIVPQSILEHCRLRSWKNYPFDEIPQCQTPEYLETPLDEETESAHIRCILDKSQRRRYHYPTGIDAVQSFQPSYWMIQSLSHITNGTLTFWSCPGLPV